MAQRYAELLPELKRRGVHMAFAGIALPNPANRAAIINQKKLEAKPQKSNPIPVKNAPVIIRKA